VSKKGDLLTKACTRNVYLKKQLEAADALAKAGRHLTTNEDWLRFDKALAAYEKVRGISLYGVPVKTDPTLKPGDWRLEKP